MKTSETIGISATSDLVARSGSFDRATEQDIFYGAEQTPTADYKGIYNTNSKALAQIVSKHYQIIQHPDVLRAIGEVLDEAGVKVNGMVKDFGNQIQGNLVFDNQGEPVQDPESGIRLGIRFLNSYNKSTSFRLELYGFRMICQNGMALGQALHNVREVTFHMGQEKTVDTLKEIVRRFITNAMDSTETLQGYIDQCINDRADWNSIGKLLEKLFQHKKHRDKIGEILGISFIEVVDKKTKKKTYNYVLEKEGKKNITRWELYNAITNYASHNDLGLSVENRIQETAQKILRKNYERLLEVDE